MLSYKQFLNITAAQHFATSQIGPHLKKVSDLILRMKYNTSFGVLKNMAYCTAGIMLFQYFYKLNVKTAAYVSITFCSEPFFLY